MSVQDGNQEEQAVVAVQLPTPAVSSSPTNNNLSDFEARALNRRVRKAETKKAEIQRRFNSQGPPPCVISEVYPPELYNTWVRTGRSEMQGRRPTMEDAYTVEPHFRKLENSAEEQVFIGVYDGHGGSKASEYVGNQLHLFFRKKLDLYEKFIKELESGVASPSVKQSDILKYVLSYMNVPHYIEDQVQEEDDGEVHVIPDEEDEDDQAAEKNAKKSDDDLVLSDDDDDDDDDDQNQPTSSRAEKSIEPIDLTTLSEPEVHMLLLRESFIEANELMRITKVPAGTTASVAYLYGKRCIIANVGDSRIVLYRNGQPVRLTVDHRPNDPDEVARIKETGGFVVNERVNGMLAVTRAIGDCFLEPMVTADPYTACVDLNDTQDEFMIIACDGVWDYVNDMDACNIVSKEDDPRVAAKNLRDYAYNRGSTDNISVVVLRFNWATSKKLLGGSSSNNNNSNCSSPSSPVPSPVGVAAVAVKSPNESSLSAAATTVQSPSLPVVQSPEKEAVQSMPQVAAVLPTIVPEDKSE